MNNLVDQDGENKAVRAFLQQFQGNHLITSGQMLQHLKWCGFDLALPEWANPDLHITAGEAQAWIRHLFALEAVWPVIDCPVCPNCGQEQPFCPNWNFGDFECVGCGEVFFAARGTIHAR